MSGILMLIFLHTRVLKTEENPMFQSPHGAVLTIVHILLCVGHGVFT